MDYKKLETVIYSQGFVESFLENYAADQVEGDEHTKQLMAAWTYLSEGVDALRRENSELQSTLFNARTALS